MILLDLAINLRTITDSEKKNVMMNTSHRFSFSEKSKLALKFKNSANLPDLSIEIAMRTLPEIR